jgi:tetratricopeptide (TPR) repeat protein
MINRIITYNKKTWFLLCLFFVIFSTGVKAQNNIIDSLESVLVGSEDDERIDILVMLSWHMHRVDPDKAEEFALEGVALSKKAGNLKGEINCKIDLGAIELYRGNFEKAIEYNFEALKFREQIQDSIGIAKSLNNIGLIYGEEKKYNDALKYMNNSLDISVKIADSTGMASVFNNIGTIYGSQNKFTEAANYFNKSLHIEQLLNNQVGIAESYESLGIVFQYQEKHLKAIDHFKRALATYQKENDIIGLNRVLYNIGANYDTMEKFDSALVYCHKSLELSTYYNLKEMMKKSSLTLSHTYEQMGRFQEALKYNKIGLSLSDSIYNEQMITTTNELQVAYEAEKKDKEIAELEIEKVNGILKLKSRTQWAIGIGSLLLVIGVIVFFYFRYRIIRAKQKQTELEQKALRSQMNPHFIFNSLNAIQDMYVAGETDLANDYLADFGKLMRKILDNSGSSLISVKEEMDTLRLYLEMEKLRSADLLNYEITIDPQIDQLNTLMAPLLIQPFVENAIWHGILPKKKIGKVSIVLKVKNEKLICTIEDNGIGFEESKKNKKSIGHESKGMGLTEQRLGHPIKIEDLNPGTKITLTIPI